MNKSALKSFAIKAREDLIQQVERRANIFGIDKNTELKVEEKHGQLVVNGKIYPINKKEGFKSLNRELKAKGYVQLIEEVAYTWFNRIIAIRYMEINEYLPERVNILSSSTGKAEPDILLYYETMDLKVNKSEIDEDIKQKRNEDAFRKLFIAQCNALHEVLPFLFEKIDDYTELLLPDFLLDSESVINNLVNNEDLTESFQEVEVIGWLYQFYNTDPKNEVYSDLKKNKKIEKYQIPAATQLFTPKWIVQYMIENSLGQIWLESNPSSLLKSSMRYYIEPAVQEEEVHKQLEKICYKNVNLEELKIIDPCVGSGHILVYAFDLLYQMYVETGYPAGDIPQLILEKNLYGVDIDNRAAQLASFALIMKARETSRSIFKKEINLNIYAIQESNDFDKEGIIKILAETEDEKKELDSLIDTFIDAKNYGSILQPNPLNYDKYLQRIDNLGEVALTTETYTAYKQLDEMKVILKQANVLACRYDVAVTNPPYMGSKGMNADLKNYLSKHYNISKADLFAVFIERLEAFNCENGYNATINQHSWMFLSAFEKLRKKVLKQQTIYSMLHLGARAFEEISGEVVQSTTYITRKSQSIKYIGTYARLVNYSSQKDKENAFLKKIDLYKVEKSSFAKIPGVPIAYWVSDRLIDIFFTSKKVSDFGQAKIGLQTGDTEKFLRYWSEISFEKFSAEKDAKWFPINKGGSFRKWYGNKEYVVDWEDKGYNIKQDKLSRLNKGLIEKKNSKCWNEEFYFKKGLTWNLISSEYFSVRCYDNMIFDISSNAFFCDDSLYFYMAGVLNSNIMHGLSMVLNPTINLSAGVVSNLPIIFNERYLDDVNLLVEECINISHKDWDSFETSWDFIKHPLMQDKAKIVDCFEELKEYTENKFKQLKANEEELNRIFIDIYGLQDELTPEVGDKDITIRKADRLRDTKSFLSYFIGCVMGRYSLDVDGLAYAGGEWHGSKYSAFKPNNYGIILLTDDRYFEDDIITRLREFLIAAFGSETVEENLKWIAESLELKRGETEEERLRRYFLDEFFNDHTKIYQKRPIYWLVDSGKQKGLRTLVYMHRYEPATMATIRFEHLQEIQGKYHNETTAIETRLSNANLSASEKRELDKKKDSYKKKLDELIEFDKQLAVYANQQINIDLDDGVAVNYVKFDKVLAKLK